MEIELKYRIPTPEVADDIWNDKLFFSYEEEMCIRDRCVPTYVIDATGGAGKTPVMPNYIISQTPDKIILRNYEGTITSYTEPKDTDDMAVSYTHLSDTSHLCSECESCL